MKIDYKKTQWQNWYSHSRLKAMLPAGANPAWLFYDHDTVPAMPAAPRFSGFEIFMRCAAVDGNGELTTCATVGTPIP